MTASTLSDVSEAGERAKLWTYSVIQNRSTVRKTKELEAPMTAKETVSVVSLLRQETAHELREPLPWVR